MKLNPMAAQVAGSSPVDHRARPNTGAANDPAPPRAWTRGNAPAPSSVVAGQPKPHGAVQSRQPGTHRAVSSLPSRPEPGKPASVLQPTAAAPAPAPARAPETPASSSPGAGNRVVNAFEKTRDDVVGSLRDRPFKTLVNPVRLVVSTIAAFIGRLIKPGA